MGKRLTGKRGQAFVEYLVIIVLVIAALLGVRAVIGTNINNTYNAVGTKTANMAGTITARTPE